MQKIRDYAAKSGISYEAVRKQIKRYAADLEGHIHVQGRTQYLDEVAEAFLDSHRERPGMALYEGADPVEIEQLKVKVEMLQEKLIAAQELALASQGALMEAQAARLALSAAEDKLDQAATDVETARQEATEALLREQTALSKAEELQKLLEAAEAREMALKGRSWWERLTRKGE